MLDLSMYQFYTTTNTVIAVSTYAGKTVRGIAKCNPADEFDLEKGKMLAAARCNAKIAHKRHTRAIQKYEEAYCNFEYASKQVTNMMNYKNDSACAAREAERIVEELLATL